MNSAGLINVYAYDVARLPMWQQRLWVGHNVTPNGPPSTELLQAQMETAPEKARFLMADLLGVRRVDGVLASAAAVSAAFADEGRPISF